MCRREGKKERAEGNGWSVGEGAWRESGPKADAIDRGRWDERCAWIVREVSSMRDMARRGVVE
jgi:hypothetical protein